MSERKEKSWYENDSFWETIAPVILNDERLNAATGEVDQVLKLIGAGKNKSILDMCCGLGRHSLELARGGYKVTGVDRTAVYLAQARKQAKKEGLNVEFIKKDARSFRRQRAFDLAVNLFTSFGYFEEPSDNKQVLLNVYESLKKGGKLVLETMSKEVLAREFCERRWEEHGDVIVLQECSVHKNWSWIEGRWILLKEGQRSEYKVTHWIYSAVELAGLLTECGFESVDAYGDLNGATYDHKADRLVIVAQK